MKACIWCSVPHDAPESLCDECQEKMLDGRLKIGQDVTSGRCPHCQVRFVWTVPVRLKRSLCPRCYSPLRQTTRLWQGETEAIRHPGIRGQGRLPVGVES